MSTIDPGMEGQLDKEASAFDPEDPERDLEQEEREEFAVPNRWWFASVGGPLLAGTLGPIATGFNIMALSYHWRQTVKNGVESEGHPIDDPSWCLALNGLSLGFAIVGNASLLLNMAKRVKFAIAQPVTIVGFQLAGFLLIADLAALGGLPHYGITQIQFQPNVDHALTSAYYYGIFAAILYTFIGLLMCFTVYGAIRGHYDKQFHLTLSQRSLMLQTMSFVMYLLLGGLVYCHIEQWDFLTSVYWADVTILTVGLGDYSPSTHLGRSLLFPFAIGGILILGLVIGSIRSLVLERGREKMSARMLEKRRAKAVNNVDSKKGVVKISMFAKAPFRVDPNMSAAQRREQEFNVMRKVQSASTTERKYMALFNSLTITMIMWFIGALIFMQAEYASGWTYFESLYFSYTSLLTIGYGSPSPASDAGQAFFVFWSLLAVPSLTILISNMGDTIVDWVSSVTDWVGRLTVLPGEGGFRASTKEGVQDVSNWIRTFFGHFAGPGVFGISSVPEKHAEGQNEYENCMLDRLAERLDYYVDKHDEHKLKKEVTNDEERQEKDIQFYHYVLARECRNLQKDQGVTPPKEYSWADWEYYLKLIGDEEDPRDFPGQEIPDIMVPDKLRAPDGLRSESPATKEKGYGSSETDGTNERNSRHSSGEARALFSNDGNIDREQSLANQDEWKRKQYYSTPLKRRPRKQPTFLREWSWLSDESPLLSNKTETQWILERMQAALERELNRQRKGYRAKPPIRLSDAQRRKSTSVNGGGGGGGEQRGSADDAKEDREQQNLDNAAKGQR